MEHRYKEDYFSVEEASDCISREARISDRTVSPRSHMENEKRIRREIANSNERRRMQSINAGFQSLRTLLPSHEGEKLSKAAILQQTAEYIYNLEQEKTRLLSQNCQLKRLINQHEGENHPPVKKRKLDSNSDECAGSPESFGEGGENVLELRMQLERERKLRFSLEDKLRELEATGMFTGSLLAYETNEAISVIEHNTPPNSEVEEFGEAVEEMEVPMSLISDAEIIPSSALPPVVLTQTVSTTPSIKLEDEEESPEAEAAARLMRRLPRSLDDSLVEHEVKVEVERLPTSDASAPSEDAPSCTSRQSLETIVEAIRHLEGDHLFDLVSSPAPLPPRTLPPQDAPLALTTKHQTSQRLIKVDMNPFLKYHTTQALQHQRPGVIVVKRDVSNVDQLNDCDQVTSRDA